MKRMVLNRRRFLNRSLGAGAFASVSPVFPGTTLSAASAGQAQPNALTGRRG